MLAVSGGLELNPLLRQYESLGSDAEVRMERDDKVAFLGQLVTSIRKLSVLLSKMPDLEGSAESQRFQEYDFGPLLTSLMHQESFLDGVSLVLSKLQGGVEEGMKLLDEACKGYHIPPTSWKKGVPNNIELADLLKVGNEKIVNISGDYVTQLCADTQIATWPFVFSVCSFNFHFGDCGLHTLDSRPGFMLGTCELISSYSPVILGPSKLHKH